MYATAYTYLFIFSSTEIDVTASQYFSSFSFSSFSLLFFFFFIIKEKALDVQSLSVMGNSYKKQLIWPNHYTLCLISITRHDHSDIVSLSSPIPWSVRDSISLHSASTQLCPHEQNDLKCAFKENLPIIFIDSSLVSHREWSQNRIWILFRLNVTKRCVSLQRIQKNLH